MRTIARAITAGGLALALTACTSDTENDADGSPPTSPASASPSAGAVVPDLETTTVRTVAGTETAPFDQSREVQAPPGWTVTVWARLPAARLLAWTPDGHLLVSRPKFGDVVEFAPGDGDEPPAERTLISDLNQPHGLAFSGNTLYVAESDQLNAFTYQNGAVSDRKVVVDGLPDAKSSDLRGAYAHALKSVAVGKDGTLYISVGSTGNIAEEDRDADPERATILKAPAGGGETSTFARGVRNGTGLAVDPDGGVWTAVNHRDNIQYPYKNDLDGDGQPDNGDVIQDYVNDHPFEQLAKLTEGRDLGWPYCNPEPDVNPGETDSPMSYTNRPYSNDDQLNPDGSKLDCAKLAPTEQGMGAHSAPLGLSFAAGIPGGYDAGALVGVHGSWNRRPPRPPEVSFYAWRNGTLGPQQTLLTGFQLEDGSRWGRPVMAVFGTDGAIYVSDDAAGAIYRVVPS